MKKIIILLCFLFCVFMTSCSSINSNDKNPVEEIDDIELFYIATPYCDLAIPNEYKNIIGTKVLSNNPYTIKFEVLENNQHLFTLFFGKETDNLLGTLPLNEGNVILYADFGAIDENVDGNGVFNYQGCVNTIIEHLEKDNNFLIDQIITDTEKETFTIETNIVTLHYPKKWQDVVDVKITDNLVKFSTGEIPLFDISFEEGTGDLLGYYDNEPIYLITYSIDEESMNSDEYFKYLSMQHDINVIIDYLLKDSKFAS